MNIRKCGLLLAGLTLIAVGCSKKAAPEVDYVQYVNTKIGSGGHGHVFVGANVPFGMVQLGPTSITQEWDWCSGYHDSESTVIGFSHTHLEGTGIGDLFDVTVMPVTGEVTYARGTKDVAKSGLWSYADRSKEVSEPGYYSVPLVRYDINAEVTATERVGLHRYTFPTTPDGALVFDLENGGCWDKDYDIAIEPVKGADGTVVALQGHRYSTGWAKDQRVFFYAEFSEPVKEVKMEGEGKYARVNFGALTQGKKILTKVAISPVSIEGAKANMKAELPDWDFEGVVKAAHDKWNKVLSKIKITTDDEDARTIFYTAMYHFMIHPALFCDVDGSYRGSDKEHQVHSSEGFKNYTIFSLWDTYRAAVPLMYVILPEMVPDVVNTMLKICDQQGRLPVWHLWGNETDCMVGNPGVIAVGDAIVFGYEGFDKEKAFAAMKQTMMLDDRGQDLRKQYGYIPSDKYNESIGNDMEYAIADGAVANAAAYLGHKEDAEFFKDRSHSYRHYMDPETLLARGRFADGSWRQDFKPFESNHRDQDYTEGTAWQYTWLAPQDFDGLVTFYGSKEKLVSRLDSLFAQSSEVTGENASPDIAGMIGQYAHGNEPSHHIIYFYTMADAPYKAAEKIREVYQTQYFNSIDGLSGNEDEGQMSAWYILSSLGFYQVEPASPRFWFGLPNFPKAEVSVKGGTLTITAEGLSEENKYIQSVVLNGKPYNKGYIDFSDISKGGSLTFKMGSEPKLWY